MANEFQTDKPGVMLYHTLYPQLDMLSPSECGELFRAILEYSMTGAYGSRAGGGQTTLGQRCGRIRRHSGGCRDMPIIVLLLP